MASRSAETGWPAARSRYSGYPRGASATTTVASSEKSILRPSSLPSTVASRTSTRSALRDARAFKPSGSPSLEYISINVGPSISVSIIWPATKPTYLRPVSDSMALTIDDTISTLLLYSSSVRKGRRCPEE